jgi:hypothetical protein
MLRRLVFIFIFSIAAATHAHAVVSTPERLVLAFFSKDGIADKIAVYSGEMFQYYLARPTLGQTLPPGIKATPRLLQKQMHRAVYAVDLEKDNQSQTWYVFLRREKVIWKLEAVRTLAQTKVIYALLRQLERKKNRSVKEERSYQNMLLTVSSDRKLKEYVRANIPKLQKLVTLATSGQVEEATYLAEAESLNFVQLLPKDRQIVNINIGGILENSVGILYVPDGAAPPEMNPYEYIYIDQVLDHWFLYKTT